MANLDQFAPDLLVSLAGAGPKSRRSALERELREAIRSGRLHPRTPMPSTRALARDLGVSRGIVVEAYAQLAAEGYLATRQGARTRVATLAAGPAPPAAGRARLDPGAAPYDLRPSIPDLAAFPRRAWAAAARRAIAGVPDAALDYSDGRGAPELRAALAAYLGRARGVVASSHATLVTSGTLQSLAVIARALVSAGHRRVAVEDPGFPVHRALLGRCGLEPVRIPVDGDGIDVDRLDDARVRAVLVTPAHQMPLGAVLAPDRRAALVEWAARRDGVVLEDDYDGEYRYDREPVGALQGLAPDRVAYLGTASKTLAPAVRLGWAVLPPWLEPAAAEEKAWADAGSSLFPQLVLADFVERGDLDRHLRRARLRYRRRRDLLLAGLAGRLPELTVRGAAAGLHVTAQPPAPVDELALMQRARARGVAVVAFRHRPLDGSPPQTVLALGYANVPEPSIAQAVAALAAAWP